MSRSACPRGVVADRQCARLPRGACRLFGWLAALAILALSIGAALAGGIDVSVADSSQATVKPPELVSGVFRVVNWTGSARTFQGELLLPPGWRPLAAELPFLLAPGADTLRLVSLFAPEGAAAGTYRVVYRVADRDLKGAIGGASLSVRVLPVFELQADILELPSVAIVGEPYVAAFQLTNSSNAALTLGFGVESSSGSRLKPAAGNLTLAPGESQRLEVSVQPPALTQPARDEIRLTASAPGQGLKDEVRRSVETLPRVGQGQSPYHRMKTLFTRRLGASWGAGAPQGADGAGHPGGWSEDGPQGGFQIEWSGSGALDGTGERFLSFLLRGPDLDQESIFGQESMFFVDYRGKEIDWALGDLAFTLSPLTESGVGGIGGRLGWHSDRWRVFAGHVQEWDGNQDWSGGIDGEETAVSIAHALRADWWLGLNVLNGRDDDLGAYQVFSLRQQIQPRPDLALDLEVAGSTGAEGPGAAAWLDLSWSGDPWRLRLNLLGSDPAFAGEYQDRTRAHLDLGHSPGAEPWSLWAYYRYDRSNRDQEIRLYPYESRYRYRFLDMVVEQTAHTERTAGAGAAWRAADGERWSAELRLGECRNTGAAGAPFYDLTQSLRVGYGKTLPDPSLTLEMSLEPGRRLDRLTGEQVPAWGYRGAVSWRPSKRVRLGAYLNDTIDPCQGDGEDGSDLPSLGLSAWLMLSPKSDLSLDLQAQQTSGQGQVIAGVQYSWRRDNGDTVGVQARYAGGQYQDANLMLSYTVPIDVPTLRRTDLGTLRGQVQDSETGKGIGNLVLKMDRLVAVTDARGYFSFPSVPRGYYRLDVAGGRLPVGMIPTGTLPLEIDLVSDDRAQATIGYVRGGTVTGLVQVYAPDPRLLPSQGFVQTRAGTAPKGAPGLAQGLVPTGGLGGVLVEIRQAKQVYRRRTNGNGEFRFAGLLPGTWTVSLDPGALPEDATVAEPAQGVALKPGTEERLVFRVGQQIRTMRMLAPLKVGG